MPTNLGHEAVSALKVGHESITAGYVGHEQIFPNTVEITGFTLGRANSSNFSGNIIPAGFGQNGTSGQGVSGGVSAKLGVTGEIGAQFTITGAGGGAGFNNAGSSYSTGGTLVLTQSPQYFGWDTATSPGVSSVSDNDSSNCNAGSRTPTFTINPIGSTQLASGVSATVTGSQNGGPGITYHNASVSINVTNTNRVVLTAGSNVYWGAGSSWDISWSVTSSRRTSGSFYTLWTGTSSGTRSYSTTGSSTSVSGSFTFTMTYTYGAYALPVLLYVNDAYGCNSTTGSPFGTYYYP